MAIQNNQLARDEASAVEAIPPGLADSAGFLLNKSAQVIREMVSQALAPMNLSVRELGMMRILAASAPLSQNVLGERYNIDRTTMVQIIDQLESRQLVIRGLNPSDRRSYLLYLTPRGKKTLAQALRLANKEQKKFLEPLSQAEWESLRDMLTKLLRQHAQAQ